MWKVIFKRRPYFACGWFPRCEQQGKINVPNWTRFQQSQNLFDVDLVLQWYKNTRHVLGPWFTCVLLLIVTNIQQGDGHENATWRRVDLGHAFLPPLGSSASPDGGWISFREFLGCLPFFLIHKLHHPSILLKMRLFFLIVFPRYVGCALHLLSPYFHLCLRLLPHHFQPWEAGHAICKSRRGLRTQVPACARGWCLGSFFFSKDTASLNKISSSKFPGWWQLEHFLFSPRSDLWGRWWTQLDGRILFSDGLGNSTTKIHQHPVSSLNTLFFLEGGIFGWLCGAVVGPSQVRTSSSWPQRLRLRPIVLWTWIWQRCYLHVLPCNMDAWWEGGTFFSIPQNVTLKNWGRICKKGAMSFFWGGLF